MQGGNAAAETSAPAPAKKSRSNKIVPSSSWDEERDETDDESLWDREEDQDEELDDRPEDDEPDDDEDFDDNLVHRDDVDRPRRRAESA